MNSYVKTVWINGQLPAINATNLNHIETGIYQVTEQAIETQSDVSLHNTRLNALEQTIETKADKANIHYTLVGITDGKLIFE